jgi:hypothetical protein
MFGFIFFLDRTLI